jgi:mitochondrial distribution and morphology protein 12
MSIDLNWETLTAGPDGQELAHSIRDFIHLKFQSVPLPRFIKSVTVHDFEFGEIPPELELKDITDPLPDFYEDNPEAGDDEYSDDDEDEEDETSSADERRRAGQNTHGFSDRPRPIPPHIDTAGFRYPSPASLDLGSPFFGVSPGVPGGTSNMGYFHPHLGTALSGTQTPLAAMAVGNSNWLDSSSVSGPPARQHGGHNRNSSASSISITEFGLSPATPTQPLREKHSVSTLAPTSAGPSRPPTRDATTALAGSAISEGSDEGGGGGSAEEEGPKAGRTREPRPDDLQAVFRIRYAGDVRLLLTADILLDYPMPSFVGIPVKLSITGLTFDGVGVLAKIRRRVHFCFLSPEDANTAVGYDGSEQRGEDDGNSKLGGLLLEMKVESEIGQREGGRQSLKNVGKVERFILDQVRRIFEEEFVYPSFWTFLV